PSVAAGARTRATSTWSFELGSIEVQCPAGRETVASPRRQRGRSPGRSGQLGVMRPKAGGLCLGEHVLSGRGEQSFHGVTALDRARSPVIPWDECSGPEGGAQSFIALTGPIRSKD